MNFTMRAMVLIALSVPLQAVAAPAPLVGEATDGFRKTCTYALEGLTKTVTVPADGACPAAHQIDLFPINAESAAATRGPVGPSGILSGERTEGGTKSCAYRVNGKTVFRSVAANAMCPPG
ncbi:hypothetical protein ACF3M1_02275 [Luteimonas sp. WGS1318]|uniref:hypothetical protein n=1 Tax=Luteimonas sp. WGS1318 TaxID=3366815 RepID=UPI00372D1E5F